MWETIGLTTQAATHCQQEQTAKMSRFVLLFVLKREHQNLQHSTITGYYAVSSKLSFYKYVTRQVKPNVKKSKE